MKFTRVETKPEYAAFRGEFSGQWVGTHRVSGQLIHSVQRSTRERALYDVTLGPKRAPTFVLGSSFY
jgi:hypothetical protein